MVMFWLLVVIAENAVKVTAACFITHQLTLMT